MRKLAMLAFSFAAAVFAAQYALPIKLQALAAAVFALLALFSPLMSGEMRPRILLCALGLFLGMSWNILYTHIFYAPALALDGQQTELLAVCKDYPRKTDYGYIVSVSAKVDGRSISTSLLTDEQGGGLRPGDEIRLVAKLKKASEYQGEEVSYNSAKGVFLIAYQQGAMEISPRQGLGLRYVPVEFSRLLKLTVTQIFDSETAPFMTALITGDLSLLSQGFLSALSVSGAMHTVSVSGMHISIIVGVVMLLAGRRRLTAMIGIPLVIFFMAVFGNTPSVIRAGVMQIFVLSAPLFRRDSDPVTTLAGALMLILLINPYSAASVGLQLSFASVAGILLFSPEIYKLLRRRFEPVYGAAKGKMVRRLLNYILSGLGVTLAVMLTTSPLTSLHFNSVCLIAPLTNLLILPAITYAFAGGILCCIPGMVFLPLAKAGALLIRPAAAYVIHMVELLAKVPFASLYTQSPILRLWLVFVYALALFVLINRKKRIRPMMPAISALLTLMLALWLSYLGQGLPKLSFTALDIGQGQSLVLISGNKTAVIDCGGNGRQNAGDAAAEFLLSSNRFAVDLLVLTHFDADHVNGAVTLMERMKVAYLAVPDVDDEREIRDEILETAARRGVELILIDEDTIVYFAEMELRIFAPLIHTDANDAGLAVLCSYEDFDILVTGDMSTKAENALITAKGLAGVEVLVAGHHGSKSSTGRKLLKQLAPQMVIISVGHNSYGHPAQEVLSRAALSGASVYRTDRNGNITVRR